MRLSFLLAERWLNTSEALIGKDFPGKLLEVIVALFPLFAPIHPALCMLSHLGQLTVFVHKAMKSLCEQTDFFRAVPTSSKLFQSFQSFLYFLPPLPHFSPSSLSHSPSPLLLTLPLPHPCHTLSLPPSSFHSSLSPSSVAAYSHSPLTPPSPHSRANMSP